MKDALQILNSIGQLEYTFFISAEQLTKYKAEI